MDIKEPTLLRATRRELVATVLMLASLIAAYGLLAIEGVLFILPRRLGPVTRRLFIGHSRSFAAGDVRTVRDLEGQPVMIKRTVAGFRAFSSTCPHLGCRVHWEDAEQRFFCPCHNGVFDVDGRAISGPPADAGQSLGEVPIEVDGESGAIFLRVKAAKRKSA